MKILNIVITSYVLGLYVKCFGIEFQEITFEILEHYTVCYLKKLDYSGKIAY